MKNQLKLLTLITFSCLIIYSCQKNVEPTPAPTSTQVELDNPNYRSEESESERGECSNTGFKRDTLDVTGIDLNMTNTETIKGYLRRIGFDPTLCSGECDTNNELCTIIQLRSSRRDDINTLTNHFGDFTGVEIKFPSTDSSEVIFQLRATCYCL